MSNKFSALSKAMKGETLPEQQESVAIAESQPDPEITQPIKKSRAKGKRSNPDYEQIGVYIPKKINLEVKRKLLDRNDFDFSDLVSHLLDRWIQDES
jgi:hypothetical protein